MLFKTHALNGHSYLRFCWKNAYKIITFKRPLHITIIKWLSLDPNAVVKGVEEGWAVAITLYRQSGNNPGKPIENVSLTNDPLKWSANSWVCSWTNPIIIENNLSTVETFTRKLFQRRILHTYTLS